MNNDIDERTKSILADIKGELSKDSVAAIICLENEIIEDQTLIRLLKRGDVIATYEGDRTVQYNPNKFMLKMKNGMIKKVKQNDN